MLQHIVKKNILLITGSASEAGPGFRAGAGIGFRIPLTGGHQIRADASYPLLGRSVKFYEQKSEPISNGNLNKVYIEASPGLEASPGSTFCRWRLRVRRSCARLVQFSDEAAETVARDELLAVQLEARRGRGVVGLEPLLDGAALVRMAIHLLAVRDAGRMRR